MITAIATAVVSTMLFLHGTVPVPTGTIGVVYSWKKLQPGILDEGFNFEIKPWNHVEFVDILPQQDVVTDISCVTKDGSTIKFPRITVFNQLHKENAYEMISKNRPNYDKYLITDPLRNFVPEMCKTMTLKEIYLTKFSDLNEIIAQELDNVQKNHGNLLDITRVGVFTPDIPNDVKMNFEKMNQETTRLEAEFKTQQRKLKEKETERKVEEADAAMKRSLEMIKNSQAADKAESDAKITRIKSESDAKKKEIDSEAEAKAILTIAEAERKRHTQEYIELEYYRNVVANADMYYGDKLPTYVGSPLMNKKN
jgi:regulator of protease activity HflC (stomatin/prohibitin superfamily)